MYGYHASPNAFYEPKKSDLHKTSSGLVVTKTNVMDSRDAQAALNEGKSSVIMKHDGKTSHHVEPRVSIALSPTPKLRNELMGHYINASGGAGQKGIYEYRSVIYWTGKTNKRTLIRLLFFVGRSPSQSPHHLNPHAASPHHHMDASKNSQHHSRSSGQLPSPHHQQRHSPHSSQMHPHSQQHPSPELRYRQDVGSAGQSLMYSGSGKLFFLIIILIILLSTIIIF